MKKLIIFILMLFAMACACAETSKVVAHTGNGADSTEASNHTVRIMKRDRGQSRLVIDGGLVIEPWQDGASGSGVIVEVKDGHTLVLTARHVAHTEPFSVVEVTDENDEPLTDSYAVIQVLSTRFEVSRNNEEECGAREVYHNQMNDVSLIDVSCILGSPSVLADEMPPYGSTVIVVGNPLNLYDHVFVPMEGLYVGQVDPKKVNHLMTAPIVGGYSGAGVWYNGQLVGMANSINTYKGYGQLSYLIPLNAIKHDIQLYHESLLPRLGTADGG